MAKFMVQYTFSGRGCETVEADTQEAAEALVEAKINRDDYEPDADELEVVDVSLSELHPVTRDGRELWTTYVMKGDVRGHQSALSSSPLFASGVGS
ncbi:hypothetical protein O9X81_00120 [Agrobacterium salinitolerans]|uniref:hypothetical protein n=1 Tax=Agrobacterium salinitolerans TaxID=1183413 RepID=UPI0022B8420B|nr:hypothetical protein [Agrobacterium salinitolerans]MCZ7855013.1 hypothetical protein [Agrobacterium salinitolerans]